jgi:hypothetical protein
MIDVDLPAQASLRSFYEDRAAGPPSSDLMNRLDRIPDEVAPDGPAWMHPWVGIAATVAVVVAGLAVFNSIRRVPISTPPAAQPGTLFDPVRPGGGLVALSGVTFEGVDRLVLALTGATVLALVLWVLRTALIRYIVRPDAPRKPRPARTLRQAAAWWLQYVIGYLVATTLLSAFSGPAIQAGTVTGSGVGFTERRSDGGNYVQLYDETYLSAKGGPRDLYRIGPGEPLTFVVSVQNRWPIPITILGRWQDSTAPTDASTATDASRPGGATPTGLGLLRDPSRPDGAVDNTRPFEPVSIAPGKQVAIVVTEVGSSCADPTVDVPLRTGSLVQVYPRLEFVFEAFGVEGLGSINLSPEVTVPSRC